MNLDFLKQQNVSESLIKDVDNFRKQFPLDENMMIQALSEGKPIVCSMNPGDFTESGHYIVLVGYEDGGFRVHDPNSPERSAMLWPYDRIADQIGNLWSFAASD